MRARPLTVLAQDPSVQVHGRPLMGTIVVPAEELAVGPRGYRVQVIDYDSSQDLFYRARLHDLDRDPYAKVTDTGRLISDPKFHQQNVYAIVMSVLARFERALGRRVSWSFGSHQLKVAPHAFADANAFYTKPTEALLFGYFAGDDGPVFSCLSHDVVAHESTHALLDGLRERYIDPSSPDQAAFHEGFADIVALLSVFALPAVVEALLDLKQPSKNNSIRPERLTPLALREGVLLGLAEQMGQQMQDVRGHALRQSAALAPSVGYLNETEYQEPHRRGEILVAAMLNSFVEAWVSQIEHLRKVRGVYVERDQVVAEGAAAADRLLNIAIRALDYAPPVNVGFGDFLSALLTADVEVAPDDSLYHYRKTLRRVFASYGITPSASTGGAEPGIWAPPEEEPDYSGSHFESMQRDPNELFRFVWENRQHLRLDPDPFTKVLSVRPTLRIGPDGFAVRETVAEYVQVLVLRGRDLAKLGFRKPAAMSADLPIHLHGGGSLIFDEYGRLKFHVRNRLAAPAQQERIDYLWESGALSQPADTALHFSAIHRLRAYGGADAVTEVW